MSLQSNGSVHHHYNDAIVDRLVAAGLLTDRLVAAGLLTDANRGDAAAVEAALTKMLDSFVQVPPGRPLKNFFVTPQVEMATLRHEFHGLLRALVVAGVLPSQAVGAIFLYSRASAQAGHESAAVHQLIGHDAQDLDAALKPHDESIDVKAVQTWNAR